MAVGLVDGDVQAAVADRLAGGGEAPAVTELGKDRDRAQLPDPVVRVDQCLAAGLPARVAAQLTVKRSDLALERVDHRHRDRDLLARGLGQRLSGEPRAPVADHQLAALGTSMVKQDCLDPLLPLRVLLDQDVTQSHPRTQVEDVIGRNPQLRQPPGQQQLAIVARVRTVAPRALLTAAPRRLRRLSQMHDGADRPQLLD